jgi:exportin-1
LSISSQGGFIGLSHLQEVSLEVQIGIGGMGDGLGSELSHRKLLYSGPLSKLRLLMISRMAKPEEVLIVEDENGNIVRETMKDNDVLIQYKIMRETLIYLSHLDHEDTEQQVYCFGSLLGLIS